MKGCLATVRTEIFRKVMLTVLKSKLGLFPMYYCFYTLDNK